MDLKLKLNITEVTPAQAKMLGISVCAIVSALFILLSTGAFLSYYRESNNFKRDYSYLLSLENDSKDLTRLISEYKAERKKFEALLFRQEDITSFLDKVSTLSRNYNVKISDMQAQPFVMVRVNDAASGTVQKPVDSKETGLSYMPIKMEVDASFSNLMDFLVALEKHSLILTISDISVNRGTYPILKCRFTLKLYGLKDSERVK